MVLTGEDTSANFKAYASALLDGTYEGFAFAMEGSFNPLDPLYAIKMLRREISIDDKEALCRHLILGNVVCITLYGELVEEFCIPNMETGFHAFPGLCKNPTALSFLISTVYGAFLKNSVPQLSDSQEIARKALREKKQMQSDSSVDSSPKS